MAMRMPSIRRALSPTAEPRSWLSLGTRTCFRNLGRGAGALVYRTATADVHVRIHCLRVEGGGLGQGSGNRYNRRPVCRGVAMGVDRLNRVFWWPQSREDGTHSYSQMNVFLALQVMPAKISANSAELRPWTCSKPFYPGIHAVLFCRHQFLKKSSGKLLSAPRARLLPATCSLGESTPSPANA